MRAAVADDVRSRLSIDDASELDAGPSEVVVTVEHAESVMLTPLPPTTIGPSSRLPSPAIRNLQRGSTFVFAVLPAETNMRLPIFEAVAGSGVGTRLGLADTLQFHAERRTRVVRENHTLKQVDEPLDQIQKAAVGARLVNDLR